MIKELKDGTKWVKACYWENEDLKGEWLVTYKIDGIRCIADGAGKPCTRDSKPLMHLDDLYVKDHEFYYKDWNTSMSILYTEKETIKPTQDMLYSLDPIDRRLIVDILMDPSKECINELLQEALNDGYEGLVLRQGDKWIKVVPTKYADVRITGINPGTGKYKGMAGSISTTRGNVGSFELQGLMSDTEFRTYLWKYRNRFIGKIAQVGYRELTINQKFKFPRLVRMRLDKDYESI